MALWADKQVLQAPALDDGCRVLVDSGLGRTQGRCITTSGPRTWRPQCCGCCPHLVSPHADPAPVTGGGIPPPTYDELRLPQAVRIYPQYRRCGLLRWHYFPPLERRTAENHAPSCRSVCRKRSSALQTAAIFVIFSSLHPGSSW